MSRNFGVTSRSVVGGNNQPSGSHIAPGAQRNSISSDDRELAVYVFLIAFIGLPCIFVGAVYLLLT